MRKVYTGVRQCVFVCEQHDHMRECSVLEIWSPWFIVRVVHCSAVAVLVAIPQQCRCIVECVLSARSR
jgi:hypothetical protein